MGALNWIEIKDKCPCCHENTQIRCQTHIASDYSGDERGRFHDEVYKLNEQMMWWDKNNPKHDKWRVFGKKISDKSDWEFDEECCYSKCKLCDAELYTVIKFKRYTPIEVLQIGLECDWPSEYYK